MDSRQRNGDNRRYIDNDEDEDVGSETVRILPGDDEDDGDDSTTTTSLQRGTLYSPEPESEPEPRRGHVQPYEPIQPRSRSKQARSSISTSSNVPIQKQASSWKAQAEMESAQQSVVQARRGPSGCMIIAGTFAVLALSCALLGFATLKGGFDGLGKLGGVFPSFSINTTPTVTINTSQPAVIDQIRSLSKLETVHYQLEKVVTGKSSGPLPDFLTSDKILLVAHGEVVAGIDLSDMQPDAVTVLTDTNTVLVTVPKAQILYSKLDNDKTYVYDRQTGVFNKPDPNLESQMRQVAEQQIVKAAQEDGIIAKAQTNAEQVLRTLITGLGYKDVKFRQAP